MTRVFLSLQEKARLLTRDSSHDSDSFIRYLRGRIYCLPCLASIKRTRKGTHFLFLNPAPYAKAIDKSHVGLLRNRTEFLEKDLILEKSLFEVFSV